MQHTLALALDPSLVMTEAGITADPWQKDLLLCPKNQILLNCSRQAGKSTVVAAMGIHTALFQPRSLTLILCPSLRQSLELFRKVNDLYNALGRPIKTVGDSQTRLELENGSRVTCCPGKEETIRSFSAVNLLIIDEAARVPDDLYKSVRPMLAISKGRLVCMSTPFGKRGFFWSEWESEGSDWHKVRIPWNECPRITQAFIDKEIRSSGPSWVAQEYGCSFEALEGLVYPDFEQHCAWDMWPLPIGKPVGGIDFGFRNPFAALWGVLDKDDVLWIEHERYMRETPLHEHAEVLPKRHVWYADPAGRQEIESLRHAGFSVRKGTNDIRAGIAAVTARVRTGRLHVYKPQCPNLLSEAKLYRYPGKGDGNENSETPIDDHNHALAALRYLVSKIDANFIARYRRQNGGKQKDVLEVDSDITETMESVYNAHPQKPWLRLDNEFLWEER